MQAQASLERDDEVYSDLPVLASLYHFDVDQTRLHFVMYDHFCLLISATGCLF